MKQPRIEYEAFTHSEGRPVIGKATEGEKGTIDVFLWLQPTDGNFSLRPKPPRSKGA